MNLYVWRDAYGLYFPDLSFAIANSEGEARALIKIKAPYSYISEDIKPQVLPLDQAVAFYVGGGE